MVWNWVPCFMHQHFYAGGNQMFDKFLLNKDHLGGGGSCRNCAALGTGSYFGLIGFLFWAYLPQSCWWGWPRSFKENAPPFCSFFNGSIAPTLFSRTLLFRDQFSVIQGKFYIQRFSTTPFGRTLLGFDFGSLLLEHTFAWCPSHKSTTTLG